MGKYVERVSDEAMELFRRYNWPGNVRELRNVLEAAIIMDDGPEITTRYLPKEILSAYDDEDINQQKEKERDKFIRVLTQTGWNQVRAAQILGMHRNTVRKKMMEYKIKRPPKQDS